MNESTAVIPHEHLYLIILIRQVVYKCLFDVELDFENSELNIFTAVDRCDDPTDRPFKTSSSANNGRSLENRHDTAPV